MAGAGLLTILALLLIGVPVALVCELVNGWRRWRAVDLIAKSRFRAGAGAFVLVALAIYLLRRGEITSMPDVELYVVALVAAYAGLWVVIGVAGSQGSLRYDPMSVVYWSLLGLAALGLLSIKGWPS